MASPSTKLLWFSVVLLTVAGFEPLSLRLASSTRIHYNNNNNNNNLFRPKDTLKTE